MRLIDEKPRFSANNKLTGAEISRLLGRELVIFDKVDKLFYNFNEPPLWLTAWDSVARFLSLPNECRPEEYGFDKDHYSNAYLFKSVEALKKETTRRKIISPAASPAAVPF